MTDLVAHQKPTPKHNRVAGHMVETMPMSTTAEGEGGNMTTVYLPWHTAHDRGHQWQASWGSLWGRALPQSASHGRVAANPVQLLLGLQPCLLHRTGLL